MNVVLKSREKAVSSTLGSLRAEGLVPNKATVRILKSYTKGKISAKELREQSLALGKKLAR